MNAKIELILLTVYMLQSVSSNYYEPNMYYQNPGQQEYFEYDEMEDYDTEPRHHARRHGERVRHYHQDPDDCSDRIQDCTCNKCASPTLCCQSFCASCPYISGQPNLFFVPYPYPLMVPGTGQNTTDWTQASLPTSKEPVTTTTEKVMATKAPSNGDGRRYGEDFEMTVVKTPMKMNGANNRYMLTSLRRTKPTWVPKYGIVPIPDNLAEKLMSQLREIYSLQILCFLSKSLSRHVHRHRQSVTNMMEPPISDPQTQYYEYSDSKDTYSSEEHRRPLRLKPKDSEGENEHNIARTYSRGKRRSKCKCTCNDCTYSYKPCCRNVCTSCMQPSNIVYIPYPVPMLPLNFSQAAVTVTTTTTTTTTTAKPDKLTATCMRDTANCHAPDNRNIIREGITIDPHKVDEVTVRRFANADERLIVPRYGIVPIPDDIAMKLMKQLKNVKEKQRRSVIEYRERKMPYRSRRFMW